MSQEDGEHFSKFFTTSGIPAANFSYYTGVFWASSEVSLGNLEACMLVKSHLGINVRGFRCPSVILNNKSTLVAIVSFSLAFPTYPMRSNDRSYEQVDDQK